MHAERGLDTAIHRGPAPPGRSLDSTGLSEAPFASEQRNCGSDGHTRPQHTPFSSSSPVNRKASLRLGPDPLTGDCLPVLKGLDMGVGGGCGKQECERAFSALASGILVDRQSLPVSTWLGS